MGKWRPQTKTSPSGQSNGASRSWRALQGETGRRSRREPISWGVRWHQWRRRWLPGLLAAVAMFVIGLAGAGLWLFLRQGPALPEAVKASPVERIRYSSDGVLNARWLAEKVAIPQGTSLLSVDIYEMRRKLEAEGQVAQARVERIFPDTLRIELKERQPVARVRAGDPRRAEDWLVDTEGNLYRGVNYDRATLKALPYLAGITLIREPGGGFRPVRGFGAVSHLLSRARSLYPELVREWRIIDCAALREDPDHPASMLRVRGSRIGEALFRTVDFDRQLMRLWQTDSFLTESEVAQVERVDLTLDYAVAVRGLPERLRAKFSQRIYGL